MLAMKYVIASAALVASLAGCANSPFLPKPAPTETDTVAAETDQSRPVARPAELDTTPAPAVSRPVPPAARTVEDFDVTTKAERAEAAAVPAAAVEKSLGVTVASLGDPTRGGFWIETPLVSKPGKGRVSYKGKSSQVDLIPIDGPATAGSRISLAAMRLIEAPLTELPEVEVFSGG